MSLVRPGGPLLAVALWAVALPAGETEIRPLSDQLFATLEVRRAESGVPMFERRPELDVAAALIADEVAESGRDFDGPVEPLLREVGAAAAFRVVPIIQTYRGSQIHGSLLKVWDQYPAARDGLADPRIDAIGMADARAEDGTRVLVTLLVDDLEIAEFDLADLERQTVAGINRIRETRGLSALQTQPRIADVARGHSADMAARGFFAHEAPGGTDAEDRVRDAGLEYRAVAENIFSARGVEDPAASAVAHWMNSEGHRRNILTANFDATGVGVAVSGDGVFYFTQVFLQTRGPTDDR